MWSYLKIELSKFFTNKKNIAVYILLLCFAIFYAIKIAPTYDPIEKVNYDEIQARHDTRAEFIESLEHRLSRYLHSSVVYAAKVYEAWNEFDKARMDALDAGDLKKYAQMTGEWYVFSDLQTYNSQYFYYNPRYYTYGNIYAYEDGHLGYLAAASRYTGYSQLDTKLTTDIFEERTALQTLQRLMDDYLPFVFYIGCLLLTVDIVLQDRRNPTLLRGYPLADWKKLFAKGVAAFVGSVALFIPIFFGLLIVGVQFGFGMLDLPIPVYSKQGFTTITMATYLLKTGSLLFAWYALLITVTLFMSVLIRNEFVNIACGIAIIFAEFLYFARGYGFFKPIENYPTSYTRVGEVVTNMRNQIYESKGILWDQGMLLVVSTAMLILILTLFISLSKRYKLVK